MAEEDIYGSRRIYERLIQSLDQLLDPPSLSGKYRIKHSGNLRHFKRLIPIMAAKDLSYIRRIRLLRTLLVIAHVFDKDMELAEREDMDKVMAFAHSTYKTIASKQTFIKNLKCLWRMLFPEMDERGYPDATRTPYAVRHISGRIDRSRQVMRKDKLTPDEFQRLVQSFRGDPRMQCLLTVSLEGLGRPQELLGRKLKDVELHEDHAKIYITEHGKEGIGFIGIIDSFPFLANWIANHPRQNDPEAHLFVNLGNHNQFHQLKPPAANKLIQKHCAMLGINKPITLYSLKRNGVTMRRLAGQSDVEIQHAARWTSTKQLHTYDLSNQEDSFALALAKRKNNHMRSIGRTNTAQMA